jgi:hypothetical protein
LSVNSGKIDELFRVGEADVFGGKEVASDLSEDLPNISGLKA